MSRWREKLTPEFCRNFRPRSVPPPVVWSGQTVPGQFSILLCGLAIPESTGWSARSARNSYKVSLALAIGATWVWEGVLGWGAERFWVGWS